jgi:hypothetical protein
MNPMRGCNFITEVSSIPQLSALCLSRGSIYPWGTSITYYRSQFASGRPLDIQLLPWLKSKYGRWGPSQAAIDLEDAWTFIRYYVCYSLYNWQVYPAEVDTEKFRYSLYNWQVYPAEVDTEKFRGQKITNHHLLVTSHLQDSLKPQQTRSNSHEKA